VISPEDLVLLDTDVLIRLVRGGDAGRRINTELALSERPERPLISIVTVGEVRAFSRKLGWGPQRRGQLDELVRQLVVVDIRDESVLERYAEIDHYSERKVKPARPIGQNDMWIAACASVYQAHLITSDHDYDHLVPDFIRRIKVDPRTGEIRQ
jgi:tRNA(fMet)-specific endonuclease VapC